MNVSVSWRLIESAYCKNVNYWLKLVNAPHRGRPRFLETGWGWRKARPSPSGLFVLHCLAGPVAYARKQLPPSFTALQPVPREAVLRALRFPLSRQVQTT